MKPVRGVIYDTLGARQFHNHPERCYEEGLDLHRQRDREFFNQSGVHARVHVPSVF